MTKDDGTFWIITNAQGKEEYYPKSTWRKLDAELHSKNKKHFEVVAKKVTTNSDRGMYEPV